MLAVILAGGLGTRLRPLTYTIPKPLLPVANRALVEHSIAGLPREVDEVVLAVGYKAELIEEHFRHHPSPGRTVRVVIEDRPLGTGGAIAHAVREAGGTEATFAVRNADLVDTLPMAAMLAHHRAAKALATISLWPVEDPSPFGVVKLSGSRIDFFVEKPKRSEAPSNLINAGSYLLEPEVLEYVPEQPEGELSMERVVFPELVATSRGMQGFTFQGHWIDCGRPDSYLEAHRLLLPKGATVAEGARHKGQTKGFACLGPGAVVEEAAVLEDTVLLAGAHVGRGATLLRSIVGVGARVGADAQLEDAVLGDGAEAPAGAKLRGARIPEVAA
ncbi:MAG TPA: NDP-sugar synthase [Candidatus Thermoplasmatota archaeon]|jgi:NDP-sugar pyrophosphorylase family protein|nr:NDP-sugar synthase [Candidatus Thermoplasmatota archaeon]